MELRVSRTLGAKNLAMWRLGKLEDINRGQFYP